MGFPQETIAALATPPGRGGIGVVRVSGPLAEPIATAVLGRTPAPREARYVPFRDATGSIIDTGIALFFKAPNSFTGEDVLELQGHGGPVVMDMLLQRVFALGARPSRAGEFSQRAFLNEKLDLAQAEAIADLIDSASVQAARSAQRTLQGDFSQCVHALTDHLAELRTHMEAAIDFPDEEIDILPEGAIQERLRRIMELLTDTLATAQQGSLLREGLTVVIAGRPNVGKSSLLNCLAGRDSAIVTDIAGTTRDILREHIQIDGLPLHVLDTAGLRAVEGMDIVEQHGVKRAWAAIEAADAVLLVVDDRVGIDPSDEKILGQLPSHPPRVIVRNKIDLSGAKPSRGEGRRGPEITLSARTGTGVDLLKAYLKQLVGYRPATEGSFTARRRHLEALERARKILNLALSQFADHQRGELLAEDLRHAQRALGEITGEFTSEDLLDRIFSNFCIGK